jgi:hypothetical protein
MSDALTYIELVDTQTHWPHDPHGPSSVRLLRLEMVAAAARAVVRFDGTPRDWRRVWRELEEAVAALDGETVQEAGQQDG